jgi:tRNA modification GTPase
MWYHTVMNSGDDTIAALATPVGESGIAVVRMSGPLALDILGGVLRRSGSTVRFEGEWEHRRVYHGVVVARDGEPVDDVMCAVFRGPDTYTGEDVVEISCHGSILVINRILGVVGAYGARQAEPGEFTKRAFLNGKMDLIQAEAVADLIHARSELQRQVAHEQLSGGLSRRIGDLADQILELLGIIEANIDFIEEDIDTLDRDGAIALLEEQKDDLDELLASAPFSRVFREGYRVAIAGPVNAGKSSLFNRLVGENRAIVTDIPGTTRDVLREPKTINGLLYTYHDTAGLRHETGDSIESIGIDLANETARSADLVLFVVDASKPHDETINGKISEFDRMGVVVVLNKIDLPESDSADILQELLPDVPHVRVSALTGEGLDGLRCQIVEAVSGEELGRIAQERMVLNERLVALLKKARALAEDLQLSLKSDNQLEIMALESREILALYEEATGRSYRDDLLDVIFSRFCIGK